MEGLWCLSADAFVSGSFGGSCGRLLVPGVSFDSAAPPLFTPVAPSDCNESLTCTHRDAAVEAGWHQLYK